MAQGTSNAKVEKPMLNPDTLSSARKWSLFTLGKHYPISMTSHPSHKGSFCLRARDTLWNLVTTLKMAETHRSGIRCDTYNFIFQ